MTLVDRIQNLIVNLRAEAVELQAEREQAREQGATLDVVYYLGRKFQVELMADRLDEILLQDAGEVLDGLASRERQDVG